MHWPQNRPTGLWCYKRWPVYRPCGYISLSIWPDFRPTGFKGLRNNHGTCLSNENSDNADNPSKVVVPPVTSHAWRQSVCLTPTHSGHQQLRNIDGKCHTAAPHTRNQRLIDWPSLLMPSIVIRLWRDVTDVCSASGDKQLNIGIGPRNFFA